MKEVLTFLISRELFIALALIGGAFSLLPMLMSKTLAPIWVVRFNKLSYFFMFLSIASFIFSGLLS